MTKIPKRKPLTDEDIKAHQEQNLIAELFQKWINKQLSKEDSLLVLQYQDKLDAMMRDFERFNRMRYQKHQWQDSQYRQFLTDKNND